jgi:PhnB protein
MKIEPYMMFSGRCEEALAFYEAAVGAQPVLVMASDGMSAEPVSFSGVSLSIAADDEAQAKRLFAALAAGGSTFMPMGKTFWSPCFGMCSDKFGVNWMVGVDGPQA